MSKLIAKISKTNKFENNIQRVGLKLLKADGEWVVRSKLTRIPSLKQCAHSLRTDKYGSFDVECKSSDELNIRASKKTYYYRIPACSEEQIRTLFKI